MGVGREADVLTPEGDDDAPAGPARVAEVPEAEDVRIQPGRLLPVHTWELALVACHGHVWSLAEGCPQRSKLPDACRLAGPHAPEVFRVLEDAPNPVAFLLGLLRNDDGANREVDELVSALSSKLLVPFQPGDAPRVLPVAAWLRA